MKRFKIYFSLITTTIFSFQSSMARLSEKEQDLIRKHSLPLGPMKEILDKTFESGSIKDLLNKLKEARFEFLKNTETDLQIVAKHPNAPGFILKARRTGAKFPRSLWKKSNLSRIELSLKIREYIDKEGLNNEIAVPKKWIYHIPNARNEFNDENYMVVAEELYILPPNQTTFTKQQENLIYKIINKFGLFDTTKDNIRRTLDGRIAFIDTEQPRTIPELIPIISKIDWIKKIVKNYYGKAGSKKFSNEHKSINREPLASS